MRIELWVRCLDGGAPVVQIRPAGPGGFRQDGSGDFTPEAVRAIERVEKAFSVGGEYPPLPLNLRLTLWVEEGQALAMIANGAVDQ